MITWHQKKHFNAWSRWTLRSILKEDVTPRNVWKSRGSIAICVSKSRTDLCIFLRFRQEQTITRNVCSRMFWHWVIFCETCAGTNLRDKLHGEVVRLISTETSKGSSSCPLHVAWQPYHHHSVGCIQRPHHRDCVRWIVHPFSITWLLLLFSKILCTKSTKRFRKTKTIWK